MHHDALRAGVRDGSLDSILFPTDVVANAPRILGDLQRIFPAQQGPFLVGPMAAGDMGHTPLVTLKLGVILDCRGRRSRRRRASRRAAVGRRRILRLQVNFVGMVDFESGQIEFDATLYDSRVLSFTLTGDMAVRVYWKVNANLLLTVGGFNPAYTPPPMNLPELARLNIILFDGNRTSGRGDFAVTSNTIQFGARLELAYRFSMFKVAGFLALDVLITRSPFHFVAEIAGMVAVSAGGHSLFSIRLQLTLDGSTPWRARGTVVRDRLRVHDGHSRQVRRDVRRVRSPPSAADGRAGRAGRRRFGSRQLGAAAAGRLPSVGDARRDGCPASARWCCILSAFLDVSQKVVAARCTRSALRGDAPDRGSVFRILDVSLSGSVAPTSPTRESSRRPSSSR